MQARQVEQLLPRGALARIEVDHGVRRLVHRRRARGPRVPFQGAEVRRPEERGGLVDHEVGRGLTAIRLGVVPTGEPVGRVLRQLLVPEPLGVGAVRIAVQVDRSPLQVGERERRDARDVREQLALGHRWVAGEEHLVEVRDLELPAEDFPGALLAEVLERRDRFVVDGLGQDRDLRLVGRSAGLPQPVRVRLHLVVGPSGQDRLRVLLRVPAGDGVLVLLVQQQPLLLVAGAVVAPDQHEPPVELLAVHLGVELALREGGRGVVGLRRLPGAVSAEDDVAGAVLAGRG